MVLRSWIRNVIIGVLAVAALAIVALAILLWRLSQGPLPLTFLTPTVQSAINHQLGSLDIHIDDVILEYDESAGRPRFLLKELYLRDSKKRLIARAPRASIDIVFSDLVSGRLSVREFDLIGARILIRRKRDGALLLGFGSSADGGVVTHPFEGAGTTMSDVGAAARSASAPPQSEPAITLLGLFGLINSYRAGETMNASDMAVLESIHVSRATVSLYDELNGKVWYSPHSNFVFKRQPFGFVVFAASSIATRSQPWRAEAVATFTRNSQSISVSARFFDLVPAQIAEDASTLSQLADVAVPLTGHAEIELKGDGSLVKASAEFTAAAGQIGFPDFIAHPIALSEAVLRLDYDPPTGDLIIGDSSAQLGQERFSLEGRIRPRYAQNGHLPGVGIILRARRVKAAADAGAGFDSIAFTGEATLDGRRLDIADLTLLSGESGLRVRGHFAGEDEGIGVYLTGRFRKIGSDLLKRLWPPVLAPGARSWVGRYVGGGTLAEGQFRLAVPARAILAAIRQDKLLDDGMVEVRFSLSDIATGYYHDLPPIAGLKGEARLTGDSFTLELSDGVLTLPSKRRLEVAGGILHSRHLAARQSPSTLTLTTRGAARDFLEFLDLEPLKLVGEAAGLHGVKAEVEAELRFEMPLSQQMDVRDITVTADARLTGVDYHYEKAGIALTANRLAMRLADDSVAVKGDVALNGVPAGFSWQSRFGGDAGEPPGEVRIAATVDGAQRRRLGLDTSQYLTGPTPIAVKARLAGDRLIDAQVTADLSSATVQVIPIGWRQPAGSGAQARFDVRLGETETVFENFSARGSSFSVNGGFAFSAGDDALLRARLGEVRLGPTNQFALSARRGKRGDLSLTITGQSFDARPLFAGLFAAPQSPPAPGAPVMTVDVAVDKVVAHNFEIIRDLKGTLRLQENITHEANVSGLSRDGRAVALRITPLEDGRRDMRVTSDDGGGILRASNLYSKIHGGKLEFRAHIGESGSGTVIERGMLALRDFEVRNEVALTDIGRRVNQPTLLSGPRASSLKLSQLALEFTTDGQYVRITDATVAGNDIAAKASGAIRRSDGRLAVAGTITPAYSINAALRGVPIFGQLLTGGGGQGIFALTFTLNGDMRRPQLTVNPMSVITPGVLRELLPLGGAMANPDAGAPSPKASQR